MCWERERKLGAGEEGDEGGRGVLGMSPGNRGVERRRAAWVGRCVRIGVMGVTYRIV
jgi:hypothetical protein